MVRTYIKKGGHGGKREIIKGSTEFCLTINGIETDKVTIGEWFLNDPVFKAVLVAEEQYHLPLHPITGEPEGQAGVHQHCYLETKEPMKLDEIRDIILTLTDDIGFDLQTCKSRKSWLIYITKEDAHPFIYNVKLSDCALWVRANNYIKNKYTKVQKIDKCDHFMLACGNHRNVIVGIAENHIESLREKADMERKTREPNMQCWLTRSIYRTYLDGSHMYVLGLPGMGKSVLIDRLIHGKKVWRAGHPDRFMFSGLDETVEIVLFDDFQPMEFASLLPRIQCMMDKFPCTISTKGKDDQTRLIKAQFIFVSNEPIPSQMSSLERRVRFYNVDHKMYECISCLFN